MPDPIDNENTSFLILDIARLLRAEFERRVASACLGVSPSEARTLAHVARHGPLRQRDLVDLTGLGAMSITTCLDRLECAGLVRRDSDPSDRRAKLVSASAEATPLLMQLKRIGDDVRSITRDGIEPHEWEAFHRMLKIARDNHLRSHQVRHLPEEKQHDAD
ncbi:MarR family winged helix-turn-helix transcriptional regulator [Sulfitobacter sp.]|uniref:MarR family winged helix-turn-helix transcriptional regulator n=1 Tax=Sulfitobacter sp. TaxID=1903071 RepID=UPI003EF43C75